MVEELHPNKMLNINQVWVCNLFTHTLIAKSFFCQPLASHAG